MRMVTSNPGAARQPFYNVRCSPVDSVKPKSRMLLVSTTTRSLARLFLYWIPRLIALRGKRTDFFSASGIATQPRQYEQQIRSWHSDLAVGLFK
eukprot:9501785-Pyramimonas_sp.AAC.1